MPKIYQNQSFLTIKLNTAVNISGATSLQIKYKKPSSATGSWTAQMLNANGLIKYDVASSSILDEVGVWTIWAYITFANGKSAPGEIATFQVYAEGA